LVGNIVEVPKKDKIREAVPEEELQKLKTTLAKAVEAQKEYANFTQEQVQ